MAAGNGIDCSPEFSTRIVTNERKIVRLGTKIGIQDTGENEFYQLFHPEIASPEDDDSSLFQLDFQKKLIYSFSYHGRTYYKTFYYYIDHHYGMPYLKGVVYSIK